MKVLVCHRPGGAFGYISDSWINALRDKGHTVQRWDGHDHSWHDFSPNLYIGCSGHKQPIPHQRSAKIAIHVNPYGPTKIQGIAESDENIRWTLNQKPDVVFGYGHEDDRILWSYWTQKHDIPWVPMPTAGDKTLFHQSSENDKQYDIVYLGGRWQYKGLIIDAYLIPFLQQSNNYKLHGWGDWPSNICSGILAEDQVNRFLGSGRVGPCISERHTHEYGIDIPERAFKVALCGTLVVHDAVVAIRRMIPSAIIATNPDQFRNYCLHFAKPENAAERIEVTNRQRNEVLEAHTYHHRMATLFAALGFHTEAQQMLS